MYSIVAEAFLLLFLLPLGIAVSGPRIPLFPVLLAGALFTFWRCRGRVDFKKALACPVNGWWKAPLLRSCAIVLFSVPFCLLTQPELFLVFPKNRPVIWLLVVLLYPVLSVLPQEIIFRFYFFEVIASGKMRKWLKISSGAFLFSWVHIVYLNAFALWGTLIAGYVFNWIYWNYRDEPGIMWRVMLEHSLYGLIIFTVGLGGFFFLAH